MTCARRPTRRPRTARRTRHEPPEARTTRQGERPMFRQFAALVPPDLLFKAHPFELAWLLEEAWRQRLDDTTTTGNKSIGDPNRRSDLSAQPPYLASAIENPVWPPLSPGLRPILQQVITNGGDEQIIPRPFRWDHLIYAYMVENTRVYEIFRRVVFEFTHGEKLGAPTADGEKWLRNTEELFFKDG